MRPEDERLVQSVQRVDPALAEFARIGFEAIARYRDRFAEREAEESRKRDAELIRQLRATAESALDGRFGDEARQLAGQTVLDADGKIRGDRFSLERLAAALRKLRVQRKPEPKERGRR